MTETFTLRFAITPTAMTDAARLHQATFMLRYRIVAAVVMVVGVVVALAVDESVGLWLATFGFLLLATTWLQVLDRLLYRNRGRGVMGAIVEYVVDDGGILTTGPLGTRTLDWSALTDVRANSRTVIFGRDRVLAGYVPTSAFASAAERDAFVAFARARVGRLAPDA